MASQIKRCAIYTRKSSDEGLDQSFNSLDAQRAACEAYVLSQTSEGWSALPDHYDDGGFSGGNTDRPGLRQLLADIEAGKVDIVVVYKIDRLTRSLADFARIVEVFEKHDCSFVSVTQSFNTTGSMGKLMLNVLLSFAQFEREVTGERIRDKIAASKARGMWMGGIPPLGYDPPNDGTRTLKVNEVEADQVRHIFERYLELGSVHILQRDLEERGIHSKIRVTARGRTMGGQPIGRGALFYLLRNRIYLGQIVHKDKVHDGQHKAIVDVGLFQRVQVSLDEKVQGQRSSAAQRAARRAVDRQAVRCDRRAHEPYQLARQVGAELSLLCVGTTPAGHARGRQGYCSAAPGDCDRTRGWRGHPALAAKGRRSVLYPEIGQSQRARHACHH